LDKLHGLGTASVINTSMTTQYLLPKARNLVTGQTVKTQDLTGNRFTLDQRTIAEEQAERLARNMENRTRDPWVGFVEQYTPSQRRS
jgi:hypothetical protein